MKFVFLSFFNTEMIDKVYLVTKDAMANERRCCAFNPYVVNCFFFFLLSHFQRVSSNVFVSRVVKLAG